jgi:hypothetical protein
MGKWRDNQAKVGELLTSCVTPHLEPGEQYRGAVHATQAKTFSAEAFAVGVTDRRLVVVPLDKKMRPSGEPVVSIRPGDIQSSSVWGWEGGARNFLSMSSGNEIRVEANGRKYKWMTLGGTMLENALAGDAQLDGLAALVDFIRAAQQARGG